MELEIKVRNYKIHCKFNYGDRIYEADYMDHKTMNIVSSQNIYFMTERVYCEFKHLVDQFLNKVISDKTKCQMESAIIHKINQGVYDDTIYVGKKLPYKDHVKMINAEPYFDKY